jgi:glycosyltransferase involved in cell wall biosynthesis
MSNCPAVPAMSSAVERAARPLRMSFLTTMPTPYMQDLFSAMVADPRMDLHVYYLAMAVPGTYWGSVKLPCYSAVLDNKWRNLFGGRVHCNWQAARQVLEHDPDVVVVGGYSDATHQLVMRQLHRRRIPWIFWGELPGMCRRGLVGTTVRRVAQRAALQWSDAIAGIGTKAVQRYRQLAGDRCAVENIPYCCDLKPFLRLPCGGAAAGRLRFLYCGQLIERKGVDLLLAAFVELVRQYPHARLTLVGEGPLRQSFEQQVPAEHRERIIFTGFKPVDELPKFFGDADVFVLPSRHDGWGVVVHQAAAAGLALICSDTVGAAADLIEVGKNGYTFTSNDARSLSTCLETVAREADRLGPMQEASRQLALRWTPEIAAERWLELGCRIAARADSKLA